MQTEISNKISGSINWDKSSFSFFSGIIDIENLDIRDTRGKPVISIDHLSLNVSWVDLFAGCLTVEYTVIEKPQVYLSEDQDGTLNLLNAFSGKESSIGNSSSVGLPFNLKINKASIKRGLLHYHAKDQDRIILNDLSLELQNGNFFQQEAKLFLQLNGGEIAVGNIRIQLDHARLDTVLFQDQLSSVLIIVKTVAGTTLNAKGRIQDIFDDFQPDLDINLHGELDDIFRSFSMDVDVTGVVRGNFLTKGPLDDPKARLVVSYMGGELVGNRIDRADISCNMERGLLNVDRSAIKFPMGSFFFTGNADLKKVLPRGFLSDAILIDEISYQVSGSMEDMSVKELSGLGEGVTGSVRSTVKLDGKGISSSDRSGSLTFNAFLQDFRKDGIVEIAETFLFANIGFEKDNIIISNLEVQTGENRLSGFGTYDLNSSAVDGNLSMVTNLSAKGLSILPIEGLNGLFSLDTSISGKITSPLIKGRLKGNDLDYQGKGFGNLSTDIMFSNDLISFDRFRIQHGRSILDLTGFVQVYDSKKDRILQAPVFDISVKGQKIFLEDFFSQMSGDIDLKGAFSGNTEFPSGRLSLTGENINLGFQKLKKIDVSIHADGDKLFINENQMEIADEEKIKVGGWVSITQDRYNLYLVSKGISLNHIDSIAMHDWGTAELFFNISGAGTFDDPKFSGEIGLNGLQLNGDIFDSVLFGFDVSDWTARIEGKDEIPLQASLHIKSKEIRGSANFDQVKLGPWFKLGGYDDLYGMMDAEFQVAGNCASLDKVSMKASIDELEVFWQQKKIIQANHFKALFENGEIKIPKTRLSLFKDGYLDVQGGGDLGGLIDVVLYGKVPISVAELFTDKISEGKGSILYSASIGGSYKNPTILADIQIQEGSTNLPYFSEKLHGLNGNIRITQDRITIEGVNGHFESGKFDLAGAIGLHRYQLDSVNLLLKAHALPIYVPNTLDIVLSGDIQLKGNQGASLVTGEVVIIEGLYSKDVELNPLDLVSISWSRREETKVEQMKTGFIDNMAFDVAVRNRNPFVVDNNISILLLQPDIHIQGTIDHPVIYGRAEVDSGIVKYQKNEFEVTRGVVDFINPYAIEPKIEMECKSQVRDWTIFLSITGTPENLKLTLSSEPSEQDGDILSLLVFGKTMREFIDGEGGTSSSPTDILAGLMTIQLQNNVKKATGLDTVELEYKSNGGSADNDTSQIRVRLGKELSRQLTIKYGFESMNSKVVQRAITEYRFLEDFMMDAYQDSDGDYGGELKYRLEFR